jgi:uridine phosphorylase
LERITESELILNENGSVYHLNLLPGDICSNIITVGDPERVERVAAFFDSIRIKRKNREFETITGFLNGVELTVISTGIGTTNIDIVLNELDALVNIDLATRRLKEDHTSLNFFRLGTSGSIQSDLTLGSLLISQKSVALEGIFHYYKEADALVCEKWDGLDELNHGLKSYVFQADAQLLSRFEKLGLLGITATLGGFYAPQGRSIRIGSTAKEWLHQLSDFRHNDQRITNIEMETAGLYGFAKMLGHKAISINAILANRLDGEFAPNPNSIIDDMIKKFLQIITNVDSSSR